MFYGKDEAPPDPLEAGAKAWSSASQCLILVGCICSVFRAGDRITEFPNSLALPPLHNVYAVSAIMHDLS